MATSGTSDGLNTVQNVADAVLVDILGIKGLGEDLAPEEASVVIRSLNWMLKSWQVDGVGRRARRDELAIAWPASQSYCQLSVNFLDIDNVFVRTSGIDVQLDPYSDDEYAAIPNKSSEAARPLIYNVGKSITTMTLRVWPVPEGAITLYADGQRVIEDVTALTETLDIPQEWTEAVHYGLAARLGGTSVFKVHLTDPALFANVRDMAQMLYANLKARDTETASVFLQPG
jgi:hypothetical protein